MNTGEKLKKLISLCRCSVYLEVNKHKDYYMTAEEELKEKDGRECPPEINDDVRKIMIETNTIVCIQFYPHTPVGFYVVYHYDLDKCLDDALSCFDNDKTIQI
jgi:hypothetical protein